MTTISTHPARTLKADYLPKFALYNKETQTEPQATDIGWQLSPHPYQLSQEQFQTLQNLGPALLSFLEALDTLYKHSISQAPAKGQLIPGWVKDYFHQGKPEALIQFAQMKRFRSQLPIVIRPDLLITANGFALTEIDSVPGGIGFLSALNEAYRESGFDIIESINPDSGDTNSLPNGFLDALKAITPELESPTIGIIVSDEAQDYRAEWQWFVNKLQESYPNIHLLHPKQIQLNQDKLVAILEDGQAITLDTIYRFFELFDLPNIPQIELIQYALKKRIVHGTPPFKSHLEEKMMLAFFHHPALQGFWQSHISKEHYQLLKACIPPTWIVDPTPLPPHAVIADLAPSGQSIQSFTELGNLSQKGRELVLKPSGFSPLAWGSRGVTIGHDVSGEVWKEKIQEALNAFESTPYILQTFQNPLAKSFSRLDISTGNSQEFQAKTRLCPYYLVQADKQGKTAVSLSGILATACPSDKKIIHGMKDAVLAPCSVE